MGYAMNFSNSNPPKVGMRVKCINNEQSEKKLILNQIYTISYVELQSITRSGIGVWVDERIPKRRCSSRFVLVEDETPVGWDAP